MLNNSIAFSGFSVNDLVEAKKFYSEILKLDVTEDNMGLHINLKGAGSVFVYQKEDHVPATFTILNFSVENIDKTIDELISLGVKFEHYDLGNDAKQDQKGVLRGLSYNMGPDIAWFKDPSGNIFSILKEK